MRAQAEWIGPGSLAALAGLVAELDPRKLMLVTGTNSYAASGARDRVEPAIAGRTIVRFSGVSANPKIEDVERGIALRRSERPAAIMAVGGGSVLDVAKLIGLLGPSAASWRAFLAGGGTPDQHGVPLIAIPTTAGSGAEATRFSAFYVDGEKQSISHPQLRPSHAIVDPLLTHSMPPELTAPTGLDALAQAIESFWAVGATPESQTLAEAAVSEILPYLRGAVRAPTPVIRERMSRGAHLAGQAIDISRTTAAHALSYALTVEFGLPHGHAVALVLPWILRINSRPGNRPIVDPRGAAYVAGTVERVVRLLGCRNGEEAACLLETLVFETGLATRLPRRAVGAATKAAALAAKVNLERLGNNPVLVSHEDAVAIYMRLFESAAVRARA